MRFLALVCLIGLLLSVAITYKTSAKASSTTCISPNAYQVITGTPVVPTANQPSLVLNEVLPFPHFGWNCDYQSTPGALQSMWIELYNLTDKPLDLYNRQEEICVDTGSGTIPACLKSNSVIPAHGFFTFFPYLLSPGFVLQENSNLRLLLDSAQVDQVTIPALPIDVSYARISDGTGKWQQATNPTINASNTSTTLPSPTPTHLHTAHEGKSKVAAQGRRKYVKNPGSGHTDAISQTITDTASDDHTQVHNDNGKQVQWHNLQFPLSPASPSVLTTVQDIHSTPSSPPTPTENIPQNVLFSFIGIAGLLSLWWGWRRFFKKKI